MAEFPPIVVGLAIVPKITAVFSILGSSFIVREVASSKKKRGDTYQRLVAAMSFCDVIGSIGAFLGTWPIPAGTPGVYAAVGTVETCIAAGFFNQLVGPCTPMYSGALGIYYICKIKYNLPERKIQQMETICHVVILSIGVLTAIAGLPLKLYNNADNWVCWIAEEPLGCYDTYRYGEELANCNRGNNAWIYQWAWFYSFGWASFLVMTISLLIVYMHVLQLEKNSDAYSFDGEVRRDNSNAVFWQGVLYCFAFMLTWAWTTLSRILYLTTGQVYFTLLFLLAAFWPLQGFWNFFIYLRPRYQKYRKKYPEGPFWHMVKFMLDPDGNHPQPTGAKSTRFETTTVAAPSSYYGGYNSSNNNVRSIASEWRNQKSYYEQQQQQQEAAGQSIRDILSRGGQENQDNNNNTDPNFSNGGGATAAAATTATSTVAAAIVASSAGPSPSTSITNADEATTIISFATTNNNTNVGNDNDYCADDGANTVGTIATAEDDGSCDVPLGPTTTAASATTVEATTTTTSQARDTTSSSSSSPKEEEVVLQNMTQLEDDDGERQIVMVEESLAAEQKRLEKEIREILIMLADKLRLEAERFQVQPRIT